MNKRFITLFCISNIIQPLLMSSSPVLGFELNYNGDLKGNGDFSSAITCSYDTNRERLQVVIDFKNNTIKPNFVVIPIQCKQTNYEINKLLATIINTNFTIAALIIEKEAIRKTPNLHLQKYYIEKIQQEIKQGDDLVEKNNRKFYL